MSLKAFHIFFVLVSAAMSIGLGFWGIKDYLQSGSSLSLSLAVGAFAGSGCLVWYGRWFLRKLKNVSYL